MIGFVIADRDELPANFPLKASDIKPVLRVVDIEPIFGN